MAEKWSQENILCNKKQFNLFDRSQVLAQYFAKKQKDFLLIFCISRQIIPAIWIWNLAIYHNFLAVFYDIINSNISERYAAGVLEKTVI